MRRSLAATSVLLFGLSVILLLVLTLFESALVGMSPGTERFVSFLFLVLPAAIGTVLGLISLTRDEAPRWLAVLGIVLNSLFSLFHLTLLLFAG